MPSVLPAGIGEKLCCYKSFSFGEEMDYLGMQLNRNKKQY